MAIEPIGSMMSIQAQGTVIQKPVAQTEKTAEEYSNANVQPVNKVDKTTRIVENAEEKSQADNGKQNAEQQAASNEQLKKAVEQLNRKIVNNSEAVFGIHEGTNRVTIKLVDKDTKKTIKELPPEKTLDMIARVWEMAGILVDEKR